MGKQAKKTIFFIKGPVTSEEDRAKADKIAGQVVFRNALKINEDEPCEKFDFVAGAVPDNYQEEADRKAAEAEGKPPEPKASKNAPGAPKKAAKPASGAKAGAWQSNG